MNTLNDKALLACLEQVKVDRDDDYGICHNVDMAWDNLDAADKFDEGEELFGANFQLSFDKLKELFTQWPKYSGRQSYPIPDQNKRRNNPEEAYDMAGENNTKWTKNSAYGRLRWELLDWCITTLKERINAGSAGEGQPA